MSTTSLTVRQGEVLRLVAAGCTNGEIAARCGIGTATVQRHIENIRYALDARNRVHAVSRAFELGVLDVSAGVS